MSTTSLLADACFCNANTPSCSKLIIFSKHVVKSAVVKL